MSVEYSSRQRLQNEVRVGRRKTLEYIAAVAAWPILATTASTIGATHMQKVASDRESFPEKCFVPPHNKSDGVKIGKTTLRAQMEGFYQGIRADGDVSENEIHAIHEANKIVGEQLLDLERCESRVNIVKIRNILYGCVALSGLWLLDRLDRASKQLGLKQRFMEPQ